MSIVIVDSTTLFSHLCINVDLVYIALLKQHTEHIVSLKSKKQLLKRKKIEWTKKSRNANVIQHVVFCIVLQYSCNET